MRKILYGFLSLCVVALLTPNVVAQNAHAVASTTRNTATSLASLPEADLLIYISPQRILNDVAPKVTPSSEINKMRATFFDLKRSIGIDPATVEYLVLALRFQRPSGELSFVGPDVMVVMVGDFNADSLLTSLQLNFQEKVQTEKYANRTINTMKVEPIAAEAEQNPLLKSYTQASAVSLSTNSLAIGNTRYVKAAVDAADGTGRISPAVVESLLRDPNALVAVSGSPLSSFAKSFGLRGTETAPRESSCETRFGDFYGAITMNGDVFNVRGALNADNPDTAKLISSVIGLLMKEGIDAVPDKSAQEVLKQIRMTPRDNEIVWEAEIPQQIVADFIKEQTTPKVQATKSESKPKTPVRKRRRTVKK